MPNAKIRIQTPCAAAPCGFVAKIACKMSTQATLAHFGSVFRFISKVLS
jgi:hypothetical protein